MFHRTAAAIVLAVPTAALLQVAGTLGAQAQATAVQAGDECLATAPYAAPFLPPPREIAKGLSLSGHLDMETVSTLSDRSGDAAVQTVVLQVGVSLDTASADLWRSGRLDLSLAGIKTGGDLAQASGAVQTPSNIWAPDALRLYQFSYRQGLGAASLRAGVMDLNDYFDTTPAAGQLANASFGISPTLTANAPIATYPNPGVGLMGGLDWGHGWAARLGVWQGNPPAASHLLRDGAMYITELQRTWRTEAKEPPKAFVKLGAWHYAAADAALGRSTGGGYAVAEGHRARSGGTHLAAFVQFGASPGQVNAVPYYLGIGTRISGLVSGGTHDTLSLGVARAWIRGSRPEAVWEANYAIRVHDGVYLQPDLQWIQHAGGANPGMFVLALRLHLEM